MASKSVTQKGKQSVKRPARGRESRQRNGLCKITITVRRSTAWHLQALSVACGGQKDVGRVVDKLVRAHQLETRRTGGKEDSYAARAD